MYNKNSEKGFSLIELLVVIAIISVISIAVFSIFQRVLQDFNSEYKKLVSQIEFSSGIELLRADIANAGYGMAVDLGINPVEYKTSTKELILRSTLNITNKKTKGWILVDCRAGNFVVKLDSRTSKSNNQNLVFLDLNKNFVANGKYGSCPAGSNEILIGFPLDKNFVNCGGQNCYKITYRLSSSQNLNECSPNTRNLLRVVGNGNGEPVISCVKNFNVNVDTNKKTVVVSFDVQEGDKKDNRWQTVKLSVKPMNW